VRGLYGGLLPNVLGNTASWGVYMHVYSRLKVRLDPYLSGSSCFLSAATLAGCFTTLLIHPIFTVKTRLQLERNVAHPPTVGSDAAAAARGVNESTGRAVARMVREEGWLSLYKGFGPSLLLVSHGSVQFLAYENAKHALATRHLRREGVREGTRSQADLSTSELLGASVCSKVLATLATYPYQVVRSCMQQRAPAGHYRTTLGTFRHIWRAESLRGFYRGIFPHVLRSTPQASITLLVYERVQSCLVAASQS